MTETHDETTNEIPETPETAEAAEAPEAVAEVAAEVTPFFRRLRETGEVGKRQWEAALEKTRALLAKRKVEVAAAEAEAEAEALPEPDVAPPEVARPLAALRDKSAEVFTRAQVRGTGLLLNVVSRLRERIVDMEETLKANAEAEPETAAA